MRQVIAWCARFPLPVIALLGLLTLIAAWQLPRLELSISAEGMRVQDDAALEFQQRVLETFGADNATVVYISDPDLFEPDKLRAIRQVLRRIEDIPLVSRTVSLYSSAYLHTQDGFVFTDPYLKTIPESRRQAEMLRDAALKNPLINGNLLSADGSAMAINIYPDSSRYYRGFDEDLTRDIQHAIAPLKDGMHTVFHIGDHSVRSGISEKIRDDQRTILPLSLLVLVISLGLTLRRFSAMLIPILTAGLSIVWSLGLMAALGIPVNVMTSIVPALLIIIGSTEDIHMLVEYHAGMRRKMERRDAIQFMADHMGTAVFLTFITTYLGFLSTSINKLDLLQQFGLVASTGLLFNFLATVSLVPVSLRFVGESRTQAMAHRETCAFSRLADWLFLRVRDHRRGVIVALLMVLTIGAFGVSRLHVNNNVMDYFEADSEVTRQARVLHENLSGVQTLSIVLSGTEGTFLQVVYLEQLAILQDAMRGQQLFDKSFSFADFIAVLHGAIDDEWGDGEVYLPDRNEVVREYMLFIDHDTVGSLVSTDYSQARILIRHDIAASHQLNLAVAEVENLIRDYTDPELDVRITGESYLSSLAVDYMADGQARSLGLMLLVIFLLISLLFLDPKAGLVAVVVNLFPIVVLFGVMGFAGLPLDTGSAMVGAIALGICVDHTMHFMVRYQRATRRGVAQEDALLRTVRREAVPIIATAIALAAGFATLTLSSFPPVARFGLLSALVMLLALTGTFVITPLMLSYIRLITLWDVLSVRFKDNIKNDCELFRDMRTGQIRKLIALSEVRHYAPDEAIILQGDEAREMCVLLEGRAEVWRTRTDGSTSLLYTLGSGDVLGELSLMTNHRRIADVVAIEPSRVLVMHWENIFRIGRRYPRISYKLFRNLALIISRRLVNSEPDGVPIRDDLTGAFSRSYFSGLLNFAASRANRYDEPLSIMLLKVEGFDDARKEFGRQTANWILHTITETVIEETRQADIVARWVDDQFAILLPNTGRAESGMIASRVTAALRETGVQLDGMVGIKVELLEMGIGEQPQVLLQRLADSYRTAQPFTELPPN